MSRSSSSTRESEGSFYGTFETINRSLIRRESVDCANSIEMSRGTGNSFNGGQNFQTSVALGNAYHVRDLVHIPKLKVKRYAMDQQRLDRWKVSSISATQRYKRFWGNVFLDFTWRSYFLSFLPILQWLPRYKFRGNIGSDTIAGVTVAVMQIPQGMAYAMLASVPPVIGLYTSFFPPLVYFFLGTSRHGSIGTFALISMLTNTAMKSFLEDLRETRIREFFPNGNETNNSTIGKTPTDSELGIDPIQIAVVISFIVGMSQLLMGLLRMGRLTIFMSDKMISGLICGTAVQVLTSQLKSLTGVVVEKQTGVYNTILTWYFFFLNIETINWRVCLVSFSSLAFLICSKIVIDPPFKKYLKFMFPAELLLIAGMTFSSYLFSFHEKYNMSVIGHIPTGLVAPQIPSVSFIPKLFTGSCIVTAVGVALSLSIVLSYGKKHNYPVNSNQELIAYGASNVVGSFFSCIPCSISLSRSAVLDSSGARSQIACFVSCAILLVVILFLGPRFSQLPDAVLAIIIIVALRSMLAGVADLIPAYKASKAEAFVWVSTFLGVTILDIDYGLAIGIIISLGVFVYSAHSPGEVFLLGRLLNSEIYLNVEKYPDSVKEIEGIKIYGVPGPIYFGNRDTVKEQILRGVQYTSDISHVVVSFAAVSFVDSGGVDAMRTLNDELLERGIIMLLAAPTDAVLSVMGRCDYFTERTPKSVIFPTIHDAVITATHRETIGQDVSNDVPDVAANNNGQV